MLKNIFLKQSVPDAVYKLGNFTVNLYVPYPKLVNIDYNELVADTYCKFISNSIVLSVLLLELLANIYAKFPENPKCYVTTFVHVSGKSLKQLNEVV